MSKMMSTMAHLDGRYYTVQDYPFDKIDETNASMVLKKGVAYRYKTDLTNLLLPYHGECDEDFSYQTAKVGLWTKTDHHGSRIIIIRPRTRKELDKYKIGNEKDLVAAIVGYEYSEDNFMDNDLSMADIGTSVYLPPISIEDDFINKAIKLAIRQKAAPFEPYGKRMEALAVDKRKAVEGNNIKNNRRRSHRESNTMSANKALYDSSIWGLELALLVRDVPGAMHPMKLPENSILVIYPNGAPFDIKGANLIDASQLINQAVADTVKGNVSVDADEAQEEIEEGSE